MRQKRKLIRVYMYVSNDELQLPLLVSDNIYEFAAMLGKNPKTISSCISHSKHNKKYSRYVSVLVEDD